MSTKQSLPQPNLTVDFHLNQLQSTPILGFCHHGGKGVLYVFEAVLHCFVSDLPHEHNYFEVEQLSL